MNVGQRSARQLASRIKISGRPVTPATHVCASCQQSLFRRHYAQAAAAIAEERAYHSPPPSAVKAAKPAQKYSVQAGVVLSRPPQITRDLTPFEEAFYVYQRRLNERLALPFTRYFYIKADAPGDLEWKRKVKQRLTPARDIGVYNAYRKDGWHDELLVGAPESRTAHQVEALLNDAEKPEVTEEEAGNAAKVEPVERPQPRITEADRKNNQTSLNRLLQRTLYLLVQDGQGKWQFPASTLIGKEVLHNAAERTLVKAAGPDMNTWIVGNVPVAHFGRDYPTEQIKEEDGVKSLGEKIFFMKARIMAGQANITENPFGYQAFKWLAKEEVEKHVPRGYWLAIRNQFDER